MRIVKKLAMFTALWIVAIGSPMSSLSAADVKPSESPDFKEIYDLISAHLEGQTSGELNRAAVQGLLEQLHGRAWLVTNETTLGSQQTNGLATSQFDGGILDIRISDIVNGSAGYVAGAVADFSRTNKLSGIVLDLRFCSGSDYSAAADVADIFLEKELPLIDWGNGLVRSKAKTNSIKCTLMILINRETSGAAEALTAMLRTQDRTLVIGSASAGMSVMTQDFPLKDGRKLRIATAGVKVGSGETLSRGGLQPDILVDIPLPLERVFREDPFRDGVVSQNVIPSLLGESNPSNTVAGAHAVKSRPLNEAELMRERKERPGVDVDDLPLRPPTKDLEPEKPIVRDPVLGRALDLIRGISALERNTAK